jgi:hypothetical protein
MIISTHQINKIFIVITTSLVIGGGALPAYAYLDPGTGSMLIQGIIGAVAAVGVALKLYWHKLKILISGRKAEDDATKKSQDSTIEN